MKTNSTLNTTSSATNVSTTNSVLLCVVNVLFTFAGTFLNSLAIMSLLNSQLRRKVCYFMILVQACVDLVVVMVYHTLTLLATMGLPEAGYHFIEEYHLEHIFVLSLTALLTMTLERYFAVLYPFFHQKFVTKSRLMAVFLLLQLPFGIIYIIRRETDPYEELSILALIGILFQVIFFINYKIFMMAKTLGHRAVFRLGELSGSEQRNVETKQPKITLGKVSTCLLAVLCLSACYLPYLIIFGLEASEHLRKSDENHLTIYLWTRTLISMNSTLNSLIFFYRNSTLRRHGTEIMAKTCARFRLPK